MNRKSINTMFAAHYIRRSIEYAIVRAPVIQNYYWKNAYRFYNWYLNPDINKFDVSIDPFQLCFTNPESINIFTGLTGSGSDRMAEIGSIRSGNWDRTSNQSTLTGASKITDTLLFKSMKSHFIYDVPWHETEFINKTISKISHDKPWWHGCRTEQDVYDRCKKLDTLYEQIRTNGYKTQVDLIRNKKEVNFKNGGFLNALINEVTVDIGRDGTLLFVDGRHRLIISKLLGLSSIPITVITRHDQWLEKINQCCERNEISMHPDIDSQKWGIN